jgi:hypothetical protein
LTYLRIHGVAGWTGDLSSWILPTTLVTAYISETTVAGFTAPPRGNLKQLTTTVAGLYMKDASIGTAALDAWLAYANTYFATNTPTNNSVFVFSGATNGIPTGGNNNTDRLGIIAKYAAAGFTATVTVRTS